MVVVTWSVRCAGARFGRFAVWVLRGWRENCGGDVECDLLFGRKVEI